jgi:hypothetical protein
MQIFLAGASHISLMDLLTAANLIYEILLRSDAFPDPFKWNHCRRDAFPDRNIVPSATHAATVDHWRSFWIAEQGLIGFSAGLAPNSAFGLVIVVNYVQFSEPGGNNFFSTSPKRTGHRLTWQRADRLRRHSQRLCSYG